MGGERGLYQAGGVGFGSGDVDLSALAGYITAQAERVGFPRLARAGKSTVWRILNEHQLKPHKITYYLEKRDPDFDRKMHEVLMVYQEVSLSAAGEIQAGAHTRA